MTLHLEESLGEIAMRTYREESTLAEIQKLPKDVPGCQATAIRECRSIAERIIREAGIEFTGPDKIKQLCLYQPHLHKKGILFTAFIFSLVIADILGIEYLWTSDSDTIVFPETLSGAMTVIDADPTAGGSSTGLILHNQEDTAVTRVCSAVYWNELYLGRSLPASGGASDCQSGPCAAFRVAALPPILLQWYTQRILGCHMVLPPLSTVQDGCPNEASRSSMKTAT
jgi:hyaluronan synthase